MLLPEHVERGVLLPVVAAAVPERVESCPWCSKRVEDCFARAMSLVSLRRVMEVSKVGYICSPRLKESLLSNTAPSRGRSGS